MKVKLLATALFVASTVFCTVIMNGRIIEEEAAAEVKSNGTYDVTIVVDAGHGGFDGGAEAKDGTVEADINLAIALKLAEIMEDYPVEVILTRSDDSDLATSDGTVKSRKQEDLMRRKTIIDESEADLAVSIHLNSFPSDESVYGAQVFYPEVEHGRTDANEACELSKDFAETVQKSLETSISDGREREIMAKNDIIIFKDVKYPTILVECGFLSNFEESEKLKQAEYQGLLANAIWSGINEKLCLEKNTNIEVVESTNKLK